MVKNLPANAGDTRDVDSILGLRTTPGGGNDKTLQHSCLENPMTEETGRLQFIGSQRVRYNWVIDQQKHSQDQQKHSTKNVCLIACNSPSPKSHLYWPFPRASLEQFLRAIWNAVSRAAVLILPQIGLNRNFHVVHFLKSKMLGGLLNFLSFSKMSF